MLIHTEQKNRLRLFDVASVENVVLVLSPVSLFIPFVWQRWISSPARATEHLICSLTSPPFCTNQADSSKALKQKPDNHFTVSHAFVLFQSSLSSPATHLLFISPLFPLASDLISTFLIQIFFLGSVSLIPRVVPQRISLSCTLQNKSPSLLLWLSDFISPLCREAVHENNTASDHFFHSFNTHLP